MKHFKLIGFICILGLMGCQPKGSLIYQYQGAEKIEIKQLMVVIDYLNLRDDTGKFWDFDSYYHQKTLDNLFLQVKTTLKNNGFPPIESYLLSSGLLIKGDFPVEHYNKEQLQPELLHPPYTLAFKSTNDEQITQHQEVLGIMIKYIATRRHHTDDENNHRGMQMGYHFQSIDLADSTAILYIHINQSAVGIIKQLGQVLLGGAIASQADYGYVNVNLSNKKHASAFLVHKGSGQILWKNHTSSWSTDQPINEFLKRLPKS